jgi:hypothetical protein
MGWSESGPIHALANHRNLKLDLDENEKFSDYLNGSFMWMYRSSEIAHKFKIDAVEQRTSNAIQVSQNLAK